MLTEDPEKSNALSSKSREQIYEADQDYAINQSLKFMIGHRSKANTMLYAMFFLFLVLVFFVVFSSFRPQDKVLDYISYGVCIILFSIFTTLYKQHNADASKAESTYIAFLRIRIAGKSGGYGTEVRAALTDKAFDFTSTKESLLSKSKKIESPIPGHPGFDLSTKLVNEILQKALDTIEIKSKSVGEKEKED